MRETWEMQVRSLGREDPLEKEMEPHCSILVWEIPWTEEPRGLQSMGLQRAGQNWWRMHTHQVAWISPALRPWMVPERGPEGNTVPGKVAILNFEAGCGTVTKSRRLNWINLGLNLVHYAFSFKHNASQTLEAAWHFDLATWWKIRTSNSPVHICGGKSTLL